MLIGHVGFDPKLDPDGLVTTRNIVIKSQKTMEINLAFCSCLNFLKLDSLRRRMIDQRRRYTGNQSMQQILDRIRRGVLTEQYRWFICIENKRFRTLVVVSGPTIRINEL